jgi:CBS domain-containing protein
MLQAKSVMVPVNKVTINHNKTVKQDENLKTVLNLLLSSDIDCVIVEDEKNNPIGAITFEQLKMKNGFLQNKVVCQL